MNRMLYDQALVDLEALKSEWLQPVKPGFLSDTRTIAYRLAKPCADVQIAIGRTEAEHLLRKRAEKYRALTGPRTEFDKLCK